MQHATEVIDCVKPQNPKKQLEDPMTIFASWNTQFITVLRDSSIMVRKSIHDYFNVINKTTEQSADAEGKLILYFLLRSLF